MNEKTAASVLLKLLAVIKHLGPYSLSLLESKIDPVLDSRLRLGLKAQKMVFTKLYES